MCEAVDGNFARLSGYVSFRQLLPLVAGLRPSTATVAHAKGSCPAFGKFVIAAALSGLTAETRAHVENAYLEANHSVRVAAGLCLQRSGH